MTYHKRKGDVNKLWCNEVVARCAETFLKVRTRNKIALVLDDHHFQSTRSIKDMKIQVHIAQHDRSTFQKMTKAKPDNVASLIYGDCRVLSTVKNVVIDHADFCSTNKTVFPILRERFVNEVYLKKIYEFTPKTVVPVVA